MPRKTHFPSRLIVALDAVIIAPTGASRVEGPGEQQRRLLNRPGDSALPSRVSINRETAGLGTHGPLVHCLLRTAQSRRNSFLLAQ